MLPAKALRILRWPRHDGTVGPRVALLLVLAAVLTGIVAKLAYDSLRSHRRTTDRVLSDYADFAALVFARRAAAELQGFAFEPALQPLDTALARGDGDIPDPRPLAVEIDSQTTMTIDLVRCYFVLPFGGVLEVRGREPSAAVRAWIADTLTAHAREHYGADWTFATIRGVVDGAARTIVYRARRDSAGVPVMASGFEAEPAGLQTFLDYAMTVRPLLAPSLTAGVVRDSVVAITVSDPPGEILYRSAWQHDSPSTGDDSLGVQFGNLRVRATLDAAAGQTILLGIPSSSRLVLLAGLFLVSTALIAASLLLLRQEQTLTRLRSEFVASVSHELRTPLTQIRLFAETLLLSRVRSADEERRSIEIIDQEAKRLGHLVENVLYVSRSERRALRLTPVAQEITGLVAAAVESFRPIATGRRVGLKMTAPPAPVVALIDASALHQILINLLDNAVKYGPDGQTVTVGIRVDDQDASGRGTVRIWVEDQGPGIEPRHRERVWKRFVRLQSRSDAQTAGTGIGLAVVRELVELHGGRTWFEDADGTPGGGTRFVVTLPGGDPS